MENGQTQRCGICGQTAQLASANTPGYIQGTTFRIFHCVNCNTSFAENKELDTDVYQHIYAQAELAPGYNRYHYYARKVREVDAPWAYLQNAEAMYWAVGAAIKDLGISKDARILEVGCGLGYLTYSLHQAGYNCRGLDIALNAVNAAKERFGDLYIHGDIFELAGDNDPKYDLIILTEVIEHVPDPVSFLECLMKMLRSNGNIIVTTPNKAVTEQNNPWSTELPPVHLWWFSDESMQAAADRIAARVNFIDFTAYNRNHFDKMRFKVYKPYHYTPTLSPDGKLLAPQSFEDILPPKLEDFVWNTMLRLSNYKIFHKALTRPEYPIHESATLACIFKPAP
jgi:2-polyprenyl-3-methyl-5-hydroxy-6-metoxy-1,4-benzoquinol methylase